MEYLWPPCSYLEPSGPSRLVQSGGALVEVLPVRVNVSGKALTVEELLARKKGMHLSAFRFAAEELRRDLRGHADAVRARLRPEARGETERILRKLEGQMLETLAAHEATPAERYENDETYRRLVTEMLNARTHAMSALTFFLEYSAVEEFGMLHLSNATLHREYMAFLRRTLPAAPGGDRARAAERLCRLAGLLDASAAERDLEGLTPLMVAAGEGAGAAKVELLMAAGSDVNAAPPTGWTALMQAAMSGDAPTIRALCAAGASLGARDSDGGYGPLALAVFNGHFAAAGALLEAGADVEEGSGHPVLYAAVAGHADLVRLLCGRGAAADSARRALFDGSTPLMVAAGRGDLAVAQALCEAGASLGARNSGGATALQLAEGHGHAAVAQYLRDRASGAHN